MRFESSVTSVSWIPSEAVRGLSRLPFDSGVSHYDAPLPDSIDDLEALRAADRFRFANELKAWIETDAGRITGFGYAGEGHIGSTTVRVGPLATEFRAFKLPDLQHPPQVGDGWVRFVQTVGGRTGVPAPRRVRRKPFVQYRAPIVWTTLALTIHVDGSPQWELVGASKFPRHWIYGPDGKLEAKVGLTDFKDWWQRSFGTNTPWGTEESPAIVTAAETALERELSGTIMRQGRKPKVRRLKAGDVLVREGEPGDSVFLLLDGVLRVEKDGERLAELGPGALLGERAVLEGGTRTSTLVAVTPVSVAVASADDLDRDALAEVSAGHRREERS